MKKITTISKFLFLTFLLFGAFNFISAVDITESTQLTPLINVNIYESKILSQEQNVVKLSFNLSNGKGVQTGVKYGVMLIKETDRGQYIVDEKIYDELLTLAENSNNTRKITYLAPSSLGGEYSIFINVKNESGYLFGVAYVGKIKFESLHKGVLILPETCYLTIVEEKNRPKYNLTQGVDINLEESLLLSCVVNNTSETPIQVIPSFETHYRTIYGEIVSHSGGDTTPISFNSQEEKIISITLPKAIEPQAYDIKFSLKNKDESSNSVVIHYVLQGVSATIQNISLDKDYYNKGDQAVLSFSWSPSADSFPGSRIGASTSLSEITLSGTIKNDRGGRCAKSINQLVPKNQSIEIPVQIISNCFNPQLSLTITDSTGKILDQKDFNVQTISEKKPFDWALVVVIVLIILVLIIGILKAKKKEEQTIDPTQIDSPKNVSIGIFFIIFLIFISNFLPFHKSEALILATEIIDEEGGGGGGTPTATQTPPATGLNISINLDKASYSPGEEIIITSSANYVACSNQTRNLIINAALSSNQSDLREIYNNYISGTQVIATAYSNFDAPLEAGNYNALLYVYAYYEREYNAHDTANDTDIINTSNLNDLIVAVEGWVDTWDPGNYINFISSIQGINTWQELQEEIDLFGYPIDITEGEPVLDFSGEYSIPFSVVAPAVDVNLEISNNGINYSEGPITANASNEIGNTWIRWYSEVNCQCKCVNPNAPTEEITCGGKNDSNCGTGWGNPIDSPKNPFYLVRPTRFNVTCGPLIPN